eukprot:COSAG01_NODE_174_length_23022_cov_528.590978_16_plen_159_part_00
MCASTTIASAAAPTPRSACKNHGARTTSSTFCTRAAGQSAAHACCQQKSSVACLEIQRRLGLEFPTHAHFSGLSRSCAQSLRERQASPLNNGDGSGRATTGAAAAAAWPPPPSSTRTLWPSARSKRTNLGGKTKCRAVKCFASLASAAGRGQSLNHHD